MKYENFNKMTKKTFKRRWNSFKLQMRSIFFKLKISLFELAAKWGIVVKHYNNFASPWGGSEPISLSDLKRDRFVFSVSYVIRQVDFIHEYWFENKKGTKLFEVENFVHTESRISYRAELKSFLAHFSYKDYRWVSKKSPYVSIMDDTIPVCSYLSDTAKMSCKSHFCDFSECRFAFEFSFNREIANITSEEVISESYRVLVDGLTSKLAEINEKLTGVKNDGAMMSPKNQPLADNMICSMCGVPVFMSSKTKYGFECVRHGEITIDKCDRVDPIKYADFIRYNEFELEQFCECPQDSTFR